MNMQKSKVGRYINKIKKVMKNWESRHTIMVMGFILILIYLYTPFILNRLSIGPFRGFLKGEVGYFELIFFPLSFLLTLVITSYLAWKEILTMLKFDKKFANIYPKLTNFYLILTIVLSFSLIFFGLNWIKNEIGQSSLMSFVMSENNNAIMSEDNFVFVECYDQQGRLDIIEKSTLKCDVMHLLNKPAVIYFSILDDGGGEIYKSQKFPIEEGKEEFSIMNAIFLNKSGEYIFKPFICGLSTDNCLAGWDEPFYVLLEKESDKNEQLRFYSLFLVISFAIVSVTVAVKNLKDIVNDS